MYRLPNKKEIQALSRVLETINFGRGYLSISKDDNLYEAMINLSYKGYVSIHCGDEFNHIKVLTKHLCHDQQFTEK